MRRYARTQLVNAGDQYGTAFGSTAIYYAAKNGTIRVRSEIVRESQRLDIIAGREYGDSSLWWVIAAASGIGWGLQVPAGTLIFIPEDLSEVGIYVG